jgi:hypothetical protein
MPHLWLLLLLLLLLHLLRNGVHAIGVHLASTRDTPEHVPGRGRVRSKRQCGGLKRQQASSRTASDKVHMAALLSCNTGMNGVSHAREMDLHMVHMVGMQKK